MSAFVEIIFDNSDDRFPTGKPELILRRTIGMKKDEYSLDRKNATKTDVMNLLESAGFSRSNPYYIVPQGRVTALTNMKDPERLTLLKEVAGTQVYEARRTESLKIMQDTTNRRSKIDELLDYIKERLVELEEEKEELRDYQEKDKERRCLQYTIDYREQEAITSELENLDEQRQTGADDTDDNSERFLQGEKELAEIEVQINELKQQVDFLKVDKTQLDEDRKDKSKAKAKIELEVKGLSEGQTAAAQAKAQHESELQRVRASIMQHEQELAQLLPQYNSKLEEEARTNVQLEDAEGVRRRLYEKQTRNTRFRNKKERDDYLKEQISQGYPQLAKIKAVRVQNTEETVDLEKQVAGLETEIEKMRGELDGRGDSNDAIQLEIEQARTEKRTLDDERKELYREKAKLTSVMAHSSEELRRAEQELSHTMDRNTSRGLASVRRIKRQHNLDGVYGTVAELMEVNDRYRKAVEATAGNSLFHYIVDNDETASKVIEILRKENGGRVTFCPLNRVRSKPGNIPKANDSLPMLEKIQFDPIYEEAYRQIFGYTVICPNLTIAGQYSRSHGVNGVTMDGDRSDNKGAFTGGSSDHKHSRLQAVRNVSKWRDECDTHKVRSTEIQEILERKDQEITQVLGKQRKLEQRLQQKENSYGPLRQELRSETSTLENKQDLLDKKRRATVNIEASFKSLTDQQNALEAEMASAFKKDLTSDEETLLENLSVTTRDLRRQFSDQSSARSELESRKTILEIELRENLRPRLDQLRSQDNDNRSTGSQNTLKHSQQELKRIDKSLATLATRLQDLETAVDTATASITNLTSRHTATLNAQSDIAKSIEKAQKRMEKSIQKRRILTTQAADVSQRIRDLGVLPHGALERFEKVKSEQVVKRLHKVNDALKKYGHVNKMAFEQYNNFTNQRDDLEKRREELDSSASSIEELVQVLDQRKDEAIERTFKQVSREFAGVFEKLVPAGRGRLVIQRRADRPAPGLEEESDDEAGGRRGGSVENYTGVGISVSFNSKHDDQQRIQQLSGGQKSE